MIEQIIAPVDNSIFNEAIAAFFLAFINMLESLATGLWDGVGAILYGLTSVTTYGGLFTWVTLLMMALSGYFLVTRYGGFD